MKIPCKFQDRKNRFLCNRPDEPLKASKCPAVSRSFSVEDVRTSDQHRLDDRSSFSNFYTELDFSSRHFLGCFFKTSGHVATCSDVIQLFRIFWTSVRTRKRDIAKTVWTLSQAVRTYTYYGKTCAILEGGRRRPSERG
jgi:hypothetical protein